MNRIAILEKNGQYYGEFIFADAVIYRSVLFFSKSGVIRAVNKQLARFATQYDFKLPRLGENDQFIEFEMHKKTAKITQQRPFSSSPKPNLEDILADLLAQQEQARKVRHFHAKLKIRELAKALTHDEFLMLMEQVYQDQTHRAETLSGGQTN